AGGFLSDPALDRRRVIVLFSSIEEASRSYKMGFDFTALNIGNIHHAAFKKKLSPSAVITEEEERELEGLCSSGVTLDVRILPEAKESRV
ncbi:MAG: PTS sugar transporter subunit IIB, partial [Thermodesulfobacteriota bacterium]